jgi:hypothetical protein
MNFLSKLKKCLFPYPITPPLQKKSPKRSENLSSSLIFISAFIAYTHVLRVLQRKAKLTKAQLKHLKNISILKATRPAFRANY